jgi:predicted small lipoprotein YifL
MLLKKQILVRRLSLEGIRVSLGLALVLGLSGCGQPGVLYLPTDPAATKGTTRPASPTQPVPTQATPKPVEKVNP